MSQRPKMKPLSCLFVLLGLLVLSVQKTGRCERGVDPSNLLCTGAGPFPIPGSCHSYYVCQPFGRSLFPIPAECDPGTIFDEASKECRPPYLVVKPSRCVADVTTKTRRNVETIPGNTPTKTEEVPYVFPVDSSVKNVGSCRSLNGVSMCDNVNIINRYTTRVISNPSLRQSFKSQGLSIIDAVNYKEDLETAKNNVNTWKSGNSIWIGINQIYQLATQYAMEFNRKYGVYQERVRDDVSSQGTDEAFIKMLGDAIRKLEEDIKASEDALQSADLPILREYFNNNINSLQQELATKQQQLSQETSGDAKAVSALEELSYFADFVKKEAGNIEDLAKTTSDRVQMLLETLQGDSATFEAYNSAASGLGQALSNNLTEERQRYEETVRKITDETARLDKEIQDMENEVKNLRDDNEKIEVNMKKLEQQIEAKREEFNATNGRNATNGTECKDLGMMKKIMNKLLQTTKCIQANSSSPLDLDKEIKEWNQQKDLMLKKLANITSLYKEIPLKKHERDNLTDSLPSTDSIKQVEAELGRLQVFLMDVEDLTGDLHSSLTSLSEILKVLQGVECHFGGIANQLTRLTARVNAAKNDEDKLAKKTHIEQDVSRVEAQIQQLSSQISELLKECA